MAGAQVGEIDATLLTFKLRSDRPVWGEQYGEPAVSGRPSTGAHERRLYGVSPEARHCPNCGASELKIIAAILARPVTHKILEHLGLDLQPPPKGRARETGQPAPYFAGGRLKLLSTAGRVLTPP